MANSLKSGAVIRVQGWVMLKGLNQGLYRVSSQDNISYTFNKLNSKKECCRHYKTSIESKIDCFNRGDLNGIQVIHN